MMSLEDVIEALQDLGQQDPPCDGPCCQALERALIRHKRAIRSDPNPIESRTTVRLIGCAADIMHNLDTYEAICSTLNIDIENQEIDATPEDIAEYLSNLLRAWGYTTDRKPPGWVGEWPC